jgi:hypothetical protein
MRVLFALAVLLLLGQETTAVRINDFNGADEDDHAQKEK